MNTKMTTVTRRRARMRNRTILEMVEQLHHEEEQEAVEELELERGSGRR